MTSGVELIVCPGCATSYMIDPASVGAGRMVRCARCKTIWFAGAPKANDASTALAAGIATETGPRVQAENNGPISAQTQSNDFQPGAGEIPAQDYSQTSNSDRASRMPSAAAETVAVTDAPPLVPGEQEPPSDAQTDGTAEAQATAGADPANIETFAARRKRQQAQRKKSRVSSRWTIIALLLVAFNVALIGGRSDVVRALPQTASLFAAIGLPVNLRHLKFEDVRIKNEVKNGVTILLIEGRIVPTINRPVKVPRLRFAARNTKGQEIYTWTTRPDRSSLDPGESLPFTSRLASPPADAVDIVVRFYNEQDARDSRT